MRRMICILALLGAPLLRAEDDAAKELKVLAGTWKAVGLEARGKEIPKEQIPEFTFTIAADGKSSGKMAGGEYTALITVDPKKNPKTMDNAHESGNYKGKKQHGVYKFDGDKLTVCMTAPGSEEADRPKDFNTKDNSKVVVFVFERLKEDKKP